MEIDHQELGGGTTQSIRFFIATWYRVESRGERFKMIEPVRLGPGHLS